MIYLIPIVFAAVWIPSRILAKRNPERFATHRLKTLCAVSALFAVLALLEHRPLILTFAMFFALCAVHESRRMHVRGPLTPD
jgi:hypothetical protein